MKKLLFLTIATTAISLFLYALVSMDQQARHPGLQGLDLPRLISVHEFYGSQDTGHGYTSLAKRADISWPQAMRSDPQITAQLLLPYLTSDFDPLPSVVVIESGSDSEDTLLDNERERQFLANRGYAVLSVECHRPAGGEPFVAGVSLGTPGGCAGSQITELARWLVTKGVADPNAMAIIGSGIGAYTVLMAMSDDPGLFKAAIIHSAIMDLENSRLQYPCGAVPQPDDKGDHLIVRVAGEKTAVVTAQSPMQPASGRRGTILVTRGSLYKHINSHQAKAYCMGLVKPGTFYEGDDLDPEAHSNADWQTRVHIARLTEWFLARHLGGRDGRYDYIELLAKLF